MNQSEIKKLDTKWTKQIKENFEYKCVICGREGDGRFINAHHYIGRRVRSLRWNLDNGIALCPEHHVFGNKSAHTNPEWFRKEMVGRWGEKWVDDLNEKSNIPFKGSYEKVLGYLNGETKSYL